MQRAALPRLPTAAPASGDPDAMDELKVTIRSAMHEVIPYITECYENALPTLPHPRVQITAKLTLTGDPDVGTLIDTDKLEDADGHPLPAAFDDCLRSTFETLELPPLQEGSRVEVHYPFTFDER